MGQIIKREHIADFVDKLHKSGKTVVTTNGCFDILHVGHVRYLQKTKSFADYSIVLLNSDKFAAQNSDESIGKMYCGDLFLNIDLLTS